MAPVMSGARTTASRSRTQARRDNGARAHLKTDPTVSLEPVQVDIDRNYWALRPVAKIV